MIQLGVQYSHAVAVGKGTPAVCEIRTFRNARMDPHPTPSTAQEPKSALPSYLTNGHQPHSQKSSPLASRRTSVNTRERERLTASIQSSSSGRQPLDLSSLDGATSNAHRGVSVETDAEHQASADLNVAARDPRDEISPTKLPRPASPYTLNPPIDFDGLSWPSMLDAT